MSEQDRSVLSNMQRYGGSFVQALACVSKDSNPDWSKQLLEFTMTLNKVNAAIAKATSQPTGGQS